MNPEDALNLLNQFTKFIADNSDDLKEGVDSGTIIAEEIQETIQSGNVEAINSMATNIQNMMQPFQEGFSEALHDNAVLSGAKEIAGKTIDVVFSPAALAGAKIAAGALLTAAGPIGIGIAAGAAAGEIGAAAYDINRLRVMHDEACHLKEYAEYKENKEKLIEDITLQCQANDPNITKKEVRAILKESGALGKEIKQTKEKTSTKTPEEEQEEFKDVLARNLAINSVAMLGCTNPAIFISMINPVGAAVQVGLTAGRSVAMSANEMTEDQYNKKTVDTIEQRRKAGPEGYKTHNELDPESLEYKGNVAKNKLRRLVGAEEQDPTRSEISRKYDLAEYALRERLSAESLNDLSQSDAFIHNITKAVKLKRQHSSDISPPAQDSKLQEQKEELRRIKSEIAKHGTEPKKALAEYKNNIAANRGRVNEISDRFQDIANLPDEIEEQAFKKEMESLNQEILKNQKAYAELETALKRKEELREVDPEYLEKELRETEKEIKSHGTDEKEALTAYSNNISANEHRFAEASNRLQDPDNPLTTEEQKLLSEELKSLNTKIFEDKESRSKLEAALKRRDELREKLEPIQLEREHGAHQQQKAFDERIQEKENEIKRKQEKLHKLEERIGRADEVFKHRIMNKTDIPVDYFQQDIARDKLELADIKYKIERGEQIQDTTFYSSYEEEKLSIEKRIAKNERLHEELSPLLKNKKELQESLDELALDVKQLKQLKENVRLSSPQETAISAIRNQNFEVVGNKLDEAKKTGLYTSEQLKRDTYTQITEDGEKVTKTDYSKWAASSAENVGKALSARENERSTYEKIQQHEEAFDQHIGQQRSQIDASIAKSKQNIMNSLVERIHDGKAQPQELIDRIAKLDRVTFELKVNDKSLIQHLEEKGIDPTVLEAAKAKESKYKQQDIEKERQAKMNSLVKMVKNGNTVPSEIIHKMEGLDKETLQTQVDGKNIIEHMEEAKIPVKYREEARVKGGFPEPEKVVTPPKKEKAPAKKQESPKPKREKTPQELEREKRSKEYGQKHIKAREEKDAEDKKKMDKLVEMINNPKGDITTKSESEKIAAHIKSMDQEALQISVKGKNGEETSLIELIAEKNAGSHAMEAALDSKKKAFSIDQIKRATKKVQVVNKELGIGLTAARSWKRRKTTEQKLASMRDFLEKKAKHTGQAASTPNIKRSIAKGTRLL